MATSTFDKNFSVLSEKSEEFVREMTKKASPTLRKNFHSNAACLSQNEDLRQKLKEVLGK